VHEALDVDGPVFSFSGDLLHFPYRNWADQTDRTDRYTALAAEDARRMGRRGNVLKLVFGPPVSFVTSFVLRLGFLDGWRGALIAYAAARYVFRRELRILR
jgi:hypothetical protein